MIFLTLQPISNGMWALLAKFILRYRIPLISVLIILTGIMIYYGRNIQITYDYAKIIPKDQPTYIEYQKFKQTFGEDGNVLILGCEAPQLFETNFFNAWFQLGEELKALDGVKEVISVPHAPILLKNEQEKSFDLKPLCSVKVADQTVMDSLKSLYLNQPFYREVLYDPDSKATILGVTLKQSYLDSGKRIAITEEIQAMGEAFAQQQSVEMRYSGLPFFRTFRVKKLSGELIVFLMVALILSGSILLLLFRSFTSVLFPLLVVSSSVCWTLGTIVLLGFRLTALTGLIPTLIVVIGIPNCVYFINKYHDEFTKHGSKARALKNVIEKIGHVTFFANLTTAIGFGVFALMDSTLLKEFGIVAGINIATTYIISLIIIPVVYSFLPVPNSKHTYHLNRKGFRVVLQKLESWAQKHSLRIIGITSIIIILAAPGLYHLKALGYLFDDVPETAKEYKDLKFFEEHFNGVMPFEIVVDTKKKGGAIKSGVMKKVDRVQKIIEEDSLFSRPMSLIEGVKWATQTYYNQDPKFYSLPSSMERNFILKYIKNSGGNDNQILTALTDSSQQLIRISTRMKDVGSVKFPPLLDSLKQKVYAELDTSRYDISFTGTSVVALEGYKYLVDGLVASVIIAFILIALIIAYLFRSFKMLLIALIPNFIPLLITASIMGYNEIYLKPSTVLIFSVAFGISVDFTIHFLAKYRLELIQRGQDVLSAVQFSIRETGFSMIYTAIILFFGFIVFSGSSFEGTYYLGLLTSITLIVSLMTNLILLPALILLLNRYKLL